MINYILHITDIEGHIPIIKDELKNKLDFILLSGDISIGAKSINKVAKSFGKIADSLGDSIKIYYVPGNREYPEISEKFEGMPPNFIPTHNKFIKIGLSGKSEVEKNTIEDINIFLIGFGGALPGILNHFANTEEQFLDGLTKLFNDVNNLKSAGDLVILMVHNPPFGGKLDFAGTTKKHIGSKSIKSIIEKYQPDLCVCGHVHESAGIESIDNTACVNPGASKHGTAALITINTDEPPGKRINIDIIKIESVRRLSKTA